MKKAFLVAALAAAMVSTSFDSQAQTKKETKKETVEVVYKVNIHCEDCKNKIEKNIPYQKGVKDVKVDMNSHNVTVKYLTAKTDSDKIKKAIEKMDFVVETNQSKKK
ncbi:MAG: heavy-metal-associated domain-containing protein [Rikenellaceae bacterium]